MTDDSFKYLITVFVNPSHGGLRGIDRLYRSLKFDSADEGGPTDICRRLLQELPLDQRTFNDMYAPTTFDSFTSRLADWCLSYRPPSPYGPEKTRRAKPKKYDPLYGFLCLLLITLLSLAESERKRNETGVSGASLHAGTEQDTKQSHCKTLSCDEICKKLLADPAVQAAIRRVYRAPSAYSVRKDSAETGGVRDWDGLDFESLAFHRHGTTSIILRIRDIENQVRALKLILFPFFRFTEIESATRDYGLHYNPAARPAQQSEQPGSRDSQSAQPDMLPGTAVQRIVRVIASSSRWILMEFVDGMTLAELLTEPVLAEAKIQGWLSKDGANTGYSFSQLLRNRLESYSDSDLDSINRSRQDLAQLDLETLLDDYRKLNDGQREDGARAGQAVAWHWMSALGGALFDAMTGLNDLARVRRPPGVYQQSPGNGERCFVHGDLTPSNIIVNNSGDLSFTLIDLGRNYLYTQSATGRGSAESAFVAPEIREGGKPGPLTDVYSVGQLLQFMGYRGAIPEQLVFDGFYDRTSLVARFLEDLVQNVQEERLRLHPAARPTQQDDYQLVNYQQLKSVFHAEVRAVVTADRDGHWLVTDNLREVLNDLLHPWSRAWERQWKLWSLRKEPDCWPASPGKPGIRGWAANIKSLPARIRSELRAGRVSSDYDRYARALFWWSALSTLAGALTLGFVIAWFLRDAGWSWQIRPVEAAQKMTRAGDDRVPIIDALRAANYHIPDLKDNWPARLVGFSYVLVAAKYYQGLFSGLMPLLGRRPGRLGWPARAAEILMRSETVIGPILVLSSVLYQAQFWPIASAIGVTIVVACNWVTWSFADQSIRLARDAGISTVGTKTTRFPGLESYHEWFVSSAFYACVSWGIGSLVYAGVLHDIPVYAIAVASCNIFLFYGVKCGKGGKDVRVGLARGYIAAERVRNKPAT